MADRQNRLRSFRFSCAAALLCVLGCSENPVIREVNIPPVADAGDDRRVEFEGSPVEVTLDGTRSEDPDGPFSGLKFRWLSATRPPGGGPRRHVPPGESLDWPADAPQVTVRLPMGLWVFSLQVTDARFSTGKQDIVMIGVGVDVPGAAAGSGGVRAMGAGAGAGGAIVGVGGEGSGGVAGGF